MRLLLLQSRTKQTYKFSLKSRVVVTRLFSTKNKIASASPAIAQNTCYKLFINLLESFYVIKFSSQFSTNRSVSISVIFSTNDFHVIQIFRKLSTKDKRTNFRSIFHERFPAKNSADFLSRKVFPQQIFV